MVEAFPTSFLDFLRAANWRAFQEREIGLDIYLSGWWAVLPVLLGVAAATAFLLAIFQTIPLRRHSIPVLLTLGVLAAVEGSCGTYLAYRRSLDPAAPPARVLAEGKNASSSPKPGHAEAVLSLPLVLGGGVLACSIGGSLFLLVFGHTGKRKPAPPAK